MQHPAIAELSLKLRGVMYSVNELHSNLKKAKQFGIDQSMDSDIDLQLQQFSSLQNFFDDISEFEFADLVIALYAVSEGYLKLERVKSQEDVNCYVAKVIEKAQTT